MAQPPLPQPSPRGEGVQTMFNFTGTLIFISVITSTDALATAYKK